MNHVFIIIHFLLISFQVFSCCAEYNERFVPLGQSEKNLLILEIKFSRNCLSEGTPGMSPSNKFFVTGVVNILKYDGEKLVVMDSLLNFYEIECHCNYENYAEKNNTDSLFNNYYRLALNRVNKLTDFHESTQEQIVFNDSSNYRLIESDTAVWFEYASNKKFYYKDSVNIWKNISTQEPNLIAEKRIYSTKDYNIEIVQLSSEFLDKEQQRYIRHSFEASLPFWRHKTLWHGVRRDVVYLYE